MRRFAREGLTYIPPPNDIERRYQNLLLEAEAKMAEGDAGAAIGLVREAGCVMGPYFPKTEAPRVYVDIFNTMVSRS